MALESVGLAELRHVLSAATLATVPSRATQGNKVGAAKSLQLRSYLLG
jgi:hypothetical protein